MAATSAITATDTRVRFDWLRTAARRGEVCQNGPAKSHRAKLGWSMLGQFLEYSVAARPLKSSFEFFEALGFASIPVSDTLPDPYLVCFDGRIAVGLHDRPQAGAQLTFVRPRLRDYARPLRKLGVELTHEHLRDNEFNSVAFDDPGGQEVVLIEARTFPPPVADTHPVAVCGELFEITLPAADLDASSRFWQALGLVPGASGEVPHRWQRLTGHGITLGLHETHCPAGLSFRCQNLQARLEYLRATGLAARAGTPVADRAQEAATLAGPEGTQLYLFEQGAQ
jgi:catechol 2,3-dioxygenase-like lactoylglutathione lyase family enzyme